MPPKRPQKSPTGKRPVSPPKGGESNRPASSSKSSYSSAARASPEMDAIALPRDTRSIVKTDHVDNLGLLLSKVCYLDREKPTRAPIQNAVSQTVAALEQKLLLNVMKRYELAIRGCFKAVKCFDMRLTSRMVVGLGLESVHETSLALQKPWGVPYIPGSALKGVVRSWVISCEFERQEKVALEDEGFRRVFGYAPSGEEETACKGEVAFFDSFPLRRLSLEPDVMTPHFVLYYTSQGFTPPGDYHSPIPVSFLTVGENTVFRFFLAGRADASVVQGGRFDTLSPLQIAESWLARALSEHGVGAKTAVGYGRFVKISESQLA